MSSFTRTIAPFLAASAVAVASLVRVDPAVAHHSFAAEYDANTFVTLKGVVTKIEWTNPHAYVYIDVTDENGKVVNWAFEGYPPNTLKRTGFPRDLLKSGDVISITGYRARFTPNRAAGREITLADGRKVFVGPAA
jgi:hypothetical protein